MAQAIRVENLRETVRDLERLGAEVADLREWAALIAGDIAGEAAGLVAVVEGDLRNSIRAVVTGPNKAVVVAGADHAGVINYGDPNRGITGSGFLTTPANDADEHARELEQQLARIIGRLRL